MTMQSVKQKNPLKELLTVGQSVWLDYIRRSLMTTGQLKELVDNDGLRGMTSNPAIFEKAIAGSSDYIDLISSADKDTDAAGIFENLAVRDIQDAADALKGVYTDSQKIDGYVSLEVSPLLAHDTEATVKEALKLWSRVSRPNVMIKVPATKEGLPAIKQLIAAGVNINVTLLFAKEMYEAVVEAYISGLEERAASGGDISTIASVASFFVSRIDSAVDAVLEEKAKKDAGQADRIRKMQGRTAIANAKLAYKSWQSLFTSPRWEKLQALGAQKQRLLWASTSTKNPSFRDVIYVEELIGPETVNTIPPNTFDAFRDHGKVQVTVTEGVDEAAKFLADLEKEGIKLDAVTDKLLTEGVDLFADAYHKLLAAIEKQRAAGPLAGVNKLTPALPKDLLDSVQQVLHDWGKGDKVKKLWDKDASLWTGSDESKWMDWLHITEKQLAKLSEIKRIAADVKDAGYTHALLLGMGGSSLCPEVMSVTYGKQKGSPELHVLDSTDPAQVRLRESQVDLAKTIFIVSSKSGSTLEPNIFKQYFFERVKQQNKDAGRQFIAITDPGSKMEQVAKQDNFRHICYGLPGIGGRYSALSDFGVIPAALMGVDMEKFLDKTQQMVHACQTTPAAENPGVRLGVIMGVLAKAGRDKLTLITSPGVHDLGAWLEQLLAESTGKQGKAIIPVDREKLGEPSLYGNDRLFAYLRLETAPDTFQDKMVEALEKAGHPIVRINITDTYHLGQEFFRWEIATAVAGSVIGINPFDQPDVEASKVATRELTTAYEKTGKLPEESPIYEGDGVKLYTDEANAKALNDIVGNDRSLKSYLKAHFSRIKSGDYVALLAYVEMIEAHEKALDEARTRIRDKKKVATCLGFGPRFLHSTGQAYKGGPNSGVFLQITCDDKEDLKVPDQTYTFGIVKAAQARGDFQVLVDRGRRALRVHLGADVAAGLAALKKTIDEVV